MTETAVRIRRVKVSFFWLTRAARSGDWFWPDPADGDVREVLAERFTKATDPAPENAFTQHYGKDLYVEMSDDPAPLLVTVSGVRSDDLPLVLRHGRQTGEPLTIDDRDRLLEPTYVTFFAHNIVGIVRNQHTPGPSTTATAIAKVTGMDVQFLPIPRQDVIDMIVAGHGVSSFDMTIAAGSTDTAAAGSDPVAAADQLTNLVPGTDRVNLRFTAETAPQKRKLRRRVIKFIRGGDTHRMAAAHAWVSNDSGGEVVDLLAADISTTVPVTVQNRTRFLLPEAARDAAQDAFSRVQVPLTRAIELGDPNWGPDL